MALSLACVVDRCGYCLDCVCSYGSRYTVVCCFFFQAEDGIRDLGRSRGLGDVYKRQAQVRSKALSGVNSWNGSRW